MIILKDTNHLGGVFSLLDLFFLFRSVCLLSLRFITIQRQIVLQKPFDNQALPAMSD